MNKTAPILIILICTVLLGVGMVWYAQTRPKSITEYVPPVGSEPFPQPVRSDVPTTSPIQQSETSDAPADPRSWGERMRDPTVPDVPGVIWQTYINKKYGFEIEYPKGWYIETQTNGEEGFSSVDTLFGMQFSPSKDFYYNTFFYLQIRIKGLLQSIRENNNPENDLYARFHGSPIVPDAMINGLGVIIDRPDLEPEGMSLWIFFEKSGYTYILNQHEPGFDYQRNSRIAEHMVKTFRFLK